VAEESGEDFPPDKLVFTIDRGRKYDLAAVKFSGNHALEAEQLRRTLTTTKAGLIERGRLTDRTISNDIDNIRFLYTQNGYLDTAIGTEFSEDDENLTLTFKIEEGAKRTVGKVELVGNSRLSSELLLRDTALRPGNPFSPYALGADRSIILSAYENRGYRNATLDSTVTENLDSSVDINYQISEGDQYFVKAVLVAGNLTTNRSVITREVVLKPGEPLSLEGALRSETNLYELTVFNRVRVRDLPIDDPERRQTVLVKVEEAKRYHLTYGFGYSHTVGSTASEGARGTLGITDSNFLGSARTLSLSLRAGSRRQRGTLSYALPRLYGYELPTLFSFSVDNENRIDTSGDKVLIQGRPYDSFRVSASSQVRKILSRRENLIGRWEFERVDLKVPDDPSLPPEFFREEDNLLLSKLTLSYLNESRDAPLNPTRGFFLNGETTLAAKLLGSERRFFKLLTQGRYYFPLYTDVTLVSALRVGAIIPIGATPEGVDNAVPISERFFAGGPGTLRGLPLDLAGPLLRDATTGEVILVGPDKNQVPVPLGGNALIVGNLELRFPVYGIFSSVLFYDVGNVFESICTIPNEQFSNDFGLGVAIRSPIGPVRIDFAYNPSPPDLPGYRTWNIHLNIGHPF
jgi:outer membrane protein insertion porin family